MAGRQEQKSDPVRRARLALVVSVLATFLLYIFGGPLGYPLVYLSTLVHELGHGVTALLVGGTFDKFEMWKDASGLAYTAASTPWQEGLIVAGGLVGPAFAAALGFVLA